MQHPFRALSAWAVVVLAVLVVVPALLPGTATPRTRAAGPGIDPALLADASWHGRPIQRPVPRATPVADRSPSLTRGTGYRTPTGSRRVRDLQRRLLRLGYRPGTRDGLYGPRTQAAVTRVPAQARPGAGRLGRLRDARAPAPPHRARGDGGGHDAHPQSQTARQAVAPVAASDDDGPPLALRRRCTGAARRRDTRAARAPHAGADSRTALRTGRRAAGHARGAAHPARGASRPVPRPAMGAQGRACASASSP